MNIVVSAVMGVGVPLAFGAPGFVVSVESSTVVRSEGWSTTTLVEAGPGGAAVVAGTLSTRADMFSEAGSLALDQIDSQSAYVSTLRPDGMPEWSVVTRGLRDGDGIVRITGLDVSLDGRILVGGTISGAVILDGPARDVERLGSFALFLMELSQTGELVEIHEFPVGVGFGDVVVTSAAFDGQGGAIMSGWTNRDVDFTPGASGGTLVPVGKDGFVVRFDGSWQLSWLGQVEGDAAVHDVSPGPDGQTLATGAFRGNATVVGAERTVLSLTSSISSPFVVQFDSTGRADWVSQSTGGGSADSAAIEWTAEGPVIVGSFNQTISFKNSGDQTVTVRGYGARDIFVAQLSPTGVWRWIVTAGGDGVDLAGGVSTDSGGNIYAAGSGYGAVVVQGTDRREVLERERGQGALLLSLTGSGALRWGAQDYSGISRGYGVAIAGKDEVLLGGAVAGSLRFATGLPSASSQLPLVANGFALRVQQQSEAVVPGNVLRLSAVKRGGNIIASWSPPAFDGGAPILGYDVRLNRGPWNQSYRPTQTFPAPKRGRIAVIEVRAVNSVGGGPASIVRVKLAATSR